VGRVGHLRLALSGWRSLTGGATWRCQLAERLGGRVWRSHLAVSVGGPRWRTSLAVSPVAELGWSRNPSAHFDARIGRFPAGRGGHRQLALSDWWRNLAESVGGVSWRTRLADQVGGPGWRTRLAERVGGAGWRCCLWRCGFEPRLISEIRCEDRKVPSGESWSPAVGALWLALFDWQSNLAVSVGGATWRTCLADVVGGVACGGASLSPD
jgi:hypothetical protein